MIVLKIILIIFFCRQPTFLKLILMAWHHTFRRKPFSSVVDPTQICSDPGPGSHVHSGLALEPNRIRINLDPDPSKFLQFFFTWKFLSLQTCYFEIEFLGSTNLKVSMSVLRIRDFTHPGSGSPFFPIRIQDPDPGSATLISYTIIENF